MTSASSYQLPDLLSLTRHFELRTNRHCRSVTLASQNWFYETSKRDLSLAELLGTDVPSLSNLKIGLLASLCFPTCDLSQLRLVVDFWTILVLEGLWLREFYCQSRRCYDEGGSSEERGREGYGEEMVKGWWGCSLELEGENENVTVLEVLARHRHFKHLLPQLTRLSSTMSPKWNERFAQAVFAFRDAQFRVVNQNQNQKINAYWNLVPETYIPLRRTLSGLMILFCLMEAVEGFRLDGVGIGIGVEGGEGGGEGDLERIKELVADVIVLSWDIFSYNIDQSLSPEPLNIVHILLAQRRLGFGRRTPTPSPSPSRGPSRNPSPNPHSRLTPNLNPNTNPNTRPNPTPQPNSYTIGTAIHLAGTLVRERFEEYVRVEEGLHVYIEGLISTNTNGQESILVQPLHQPQSQMPMRTRTLSSRLTAFLWGSVTGTAHTNTTTVSLPNGYTNSNNHGASALASSVSESSSKPPSPSSGITFPSPSSPYSSPSPSSLTSHPNPSPDPHDLSLFLQNLQDFITGSLNWSYETELFFGSGGKGDSVRGYGWVFLMKRGY